MRVVENDMRKRKEQKQLWYEFDDNSKLWKLSRSYYLQEAGSPTLRPVKKLNTKILGRVTFELDDEKVIKKFVEV